MFTRIVLSLIFAIARMSKKVSAIYVSILSSIFLVSVGGLISGLILIVPNQESISPAAIPLIVVSGVCLVLSVVLVAMTTLASNYVRKNPHKDPKKVGKKENN
jgi:hypothetical protein